MSWLSGLFKPKAKPSNVIPLIRLSNVTPPIKPTNIHADLERLYYQAEIRPVRLGEVKSTCLRLLANKDRYQTIADQTGVPWYAIAAIHFKEASLDFRAYLGNGELIIGTGKCSSAVPSGRGPLQTFEEGAVEALGSQKGKGLDELGNLLYFLEGYNGYGYRAHGINSPYLFSATVCYSSGGYPRDHFYDPSYVIRNLGCVALFRGLGLFPKASV